MKEFSVLMPVSGRDVRSLARRMGQAEFCPAEKKVLRALLEGGCSYGAAVRENQDNDGSGILGRLEYERGVNAILQKFVPEDYLPLAKDLALVTYNEAHRCQTNAPPSLEPIKALLAA
jgi:hypothetical protein